ncbi:MAG: nuclear transport factor 2 family protein [Halieaceae bacterium]|jgi:hypothetical protein|nr:nuclear transport factor 2 family protein [Halieaceae bacterium]
MTIADRFQSYADAFELTYVDDDWGRLAQYFTEEATYDSGDGGAIAQGREAVLVKLAGAVNGLDRLMDSRQVEFTELATKGDTVVTHWTASFTKAGLPNLVLKGREVAVFEGDCIAQLTDTIPPEEIEVLMGWMGEHGDSL